MACVGDKAQCDTSMPRGDFPRDCSEFLPQKPVFLRQF